MLVKLSPIFQSHALRSKKIAKQSSTGLWSGENIILFYLVLSAIVSLAFINGPSGFVSIFLSLLK